MIETRIKYCGLRYCLWQIGRFGYFLKKSRENEDQ